MSAYDDSLLAARFSALAPESLAGDWDEVLGRAGMARTDPRRFPQSHALQRRRRRLLVVLAAATLVVVVGTAAAFGLRTLFSDRGFIGLPPKAATPSTPKNGKLAISYWIGTPGNPRRVKAWVYSDGRLIWVREGDPRLPRPPEAANRWSSGFVEQRLTRAGVERLRSEVVATGLFTRDVELTLEAPHGDPCFNFILVRSGGKLVRVTWSGPCGFAVETATPEQVNAIQRLKSRLGDPAAWLPASAWKQREFKAYVPSRFAVCFLSPDKPSRVVPLLPASAQDVLRARDWTRPASLPTYCFDVTTDEARLVAKALDRANPFKKGGAFFLNYQFKSTGGDGETIRIFFQPYLPHGEIDLPGG